MESVSKRCKGQTEASAELFFEREIRNGDDKSKKPAAKFAAGYFFPILRNSSLGFESNW
jgi:hypothetical protein